MSNNLFEELQAQFRDRLRLDVSKTRINTDREISKEENTIREKNELERLETDKMINLADIEKNSLVKEVEIAERPLLISLLRPCRHSMRPCIFIIIQCWPQVPREAFPR